MADEVYEGAIGIDLGWANSDLVTKDVSLI